MGKTKKSLEAIVIGSLILGTIPVASAKYSNISRVSASAIGKVKKCEFEPSPPINPNVKAGDYVMGWKTKTKDQQFWYIPKSAYEKGEVSGADLTGDYIPDFYWWDKNNNGDMEDSEMYFDLNSDGIIDVSMNQLKGKEKDV